MARIALEVGCEICNCHVDCEECQATTFEDGKAPVALCDCKNEDASITCRCNPSRVIDCANECVGGPDDACPSVDFGRR